MSQSTNLDDWCNLTPEQRNAHRLEWNKPNNEFYPDAQRLLDEASMRFKQEFGNHPLIYDVHPWHWDGHQPRPGLHLRTYYEPTIAVLTALYCPQRIESLPDRFLTFVVVQDQMEEIKEETIKQWREVAINIFDWPEDRIDALVKREEDGLCGREPFFYHETATYNFLHHAIPHDLHPTMRPGRYRSLVAELETAIEQDDTYRDPNVPTDWIAIRKKVERILKTARE